MTEVSLDTLSAPAPGADRIIMTTMKNEGPFLLEWVAYNLTIGFTGFVIFTNDCDDGTDLMAQRLEELGYCSHRPNPIRAGDNPQHKALLRARTHPWVQRADWLICMDVDEFINLRGGCRTLDDLLDRVGDVDAVSFAWKLFGCGGVECFEDIPVTDQFILCDEEEDFANGRAIGLKTLFRNNGHFQRFAPHRPRTGSKETASAIRWSDSGGTLHPVDQIGWRAWKGFSHEYARLHHYSVRSLESFLVKRDRGRTNHIGRDQAEHYWSDMNVNRVRDDTILHHAKRAAPIRNALQADPVLGELHERACGWHRAKIAELKERPEWADFRGWLTKNKLEKKGPIKQRDY